MCSRTESIQHRLQCFPRCLEIHGVHFTNDTFLYGRLGDLHKKHTGAHGGDLTGTQGVQLRPVRVCARTRAYITCIWTSAVGVAILDTVFAEVFTSTRQSTSTSLGNEICYGHADESAIDPPSEPGAHSSRPVRHAQRTVEAEACSCHSGKKAVTIWSSSCLNCG